MICKKCGQQVADAPFCGLCGWKQEKAPPAKRRRGNGQGSVYKLPSGKYKAVVVTGYYTTPEGGLRKHTRSQVFATKREAVAAVPTLRQTPGRTPKALSFYQLYEAWLPTHQAGKSTMDCYRSAVRYFWPLFAVPFADVGIDDLQECIDDCPHGRRTRENMRAVAGLMYKYAIPRRLVPDGLNLAQYVRISGEASVHRESFDDLQIARIAQSVATVPGADAILMMIYTGFRPSEFLALTSASYDKAACCLTGGAKTEAGKGRRVSVSPKIRALIERRTASDGPLYPDEEGKPWTLRRFTESVFYPALEACGIENPVIEQSGTGLRHKYTPHTCRHTFATLLKRIPGAEKDKLELMGHTSGDMLRYYQDVSMADLHKLTDAI